MPETDYLPRAEHNEYAKRMEEAHKRMDKRIEDVEKVVKSLGELPYTVKQIKDNQDETKRILEEIKNRPVEKVNSAKQTITNAFLTTISNAISLGFMAFIMWAIFYAITK